MKQRSSRRVQGGLTLVEVLISMAILSLVVAAIYSSWTAILRASKVGLDAAAAAQRSRIALRALEDALASAQMFTINAPYYGFVAENGQDAALSFVARLAPSFPRSGRFGDLDVRRVTFALRPGGSGANELVLRQQPLVTEMDEDEREYPLVLAKDVKEFKTEFWDTQLNDWVDEWRATNQLPKLVKVTLRVERSGARSARAVEEVARIVALPAAGVPAAFHVPMLPGGPGAGGPTVRPPPGAPVVPQP
jgi:general secretion pathway protein J